MSIKKGSYVRQVVPVIEGVVLKKTFNDSTDSFDYLVEYKSPSVGEGPSRRWFSEGQLALVETARTVGEAE